MVLLNNLYIDIRYEQLYNNARLGLSRCGTSDEVSNPVGSVSSCI